MIIDNLIQIILLLINFSFFCPLVIIFNNYKFIKYNNYFIESKDKINNTVGYLYYSFEYIMIYIINLLMEIGVIKEFIIESNKLYVVYDNLLYEKIYNFVLNKFNKLVSYLLSGSNVFKIMDLCLSSRTMKPSNTSLNFLDSQCNKKNDNLSNVLNDIKKVNLSISDISSDDLSDEEYTDYVKKNN